MTAGCSEVYTDMSGESKADGSLEPFVVSSLH